MSSCGSINAATRTWVSSRRSSEQLWRAHRTWRDVQRLIVRSSDECAFHIFFATDDKMLRPIVSTPSAQTGSLTRHCVVRSYLNWAGRRPKHVVVRASPPTQTVRHTPWSSNRRRSDGPRRRRASDNFNRKMTLRQKMFKIYNIFFRPLKCYLSVKNKKKASSNHVSYYYRRHVCMTIFKRSGS